MIKTSAHILHKKILTPIVATLLMALIGILVLSNGISISHLSLPGLQIEKLYIKLHKKLVLRAQRVTLSNTQSHGADRLDQVDQLLRYLGFLPTFFEQIAIKQLTINQESIQFFYDGKQYYAIGKQLSLRSKLSYDPLAKILDIDLKSLDLKAPDLHIKGHLRYLLTKNLWVAKGEYEGYSLKGNYTVTRSLDRLRFLIDSNTTNTIAPIIDTLALPDSIKMWIYPRVPAKRYRLHKAQGLLFFDRHGHIDLDKSRIYAHASAWNAKIFFHPDLPPVTVSRIDIHYQDDTLFFSLKAPRYQNKRLDHSHLRIKYLLRGAQPTTLYLHLALNDRLDTTIQHLLQAYQINLPFIQTRGITKAQTDLTIILKTGKLIDCKGRYISKQAELLFDRTLTVPIKDLHVTLDHTILSIASSHLQWPSLLDAKLKGKIDLSRMKGRFHAQILSLHLPSSWKEPLIALRERTFTIHADLANPIRFSLPSLQSTLIYGGHEATFQTHWEAWQPFLHPILKNIKGPLTLRFKHNETKISANLEDPESFLVQKKRPVTQMHLIGSYKKERIELTINHRIQWSHNPTLSHLWYSGYDINLTALKKRLNKLQGPSSTNSQMGRWEIAARQSTLLGSHFALPCDQLRLRPYKQGIYQFESNHRDGTIVALLQKESLRLIGKHLPDYIFHTIPALRDLHGGYFDIDAQGSWSDLNGSIYVMDTLWAKNAFYNNLLATLNTIPAILLLKDPGFDERGFVIQKAFAHYHLHDGILNLTHIAVHGKSADMYGFGTINLPQEHIAMRLRINFLQPATSLLHKIPIAGYLLFGKDGTLSIGLSVDGPLRNPHIQTSTLKDITTIPFNILKRTITLPFQLF